MYDSQWNFRIFIIIDEYKKRGKSVKRDVPWKIIENESNEPMNVCYEYLSKPINEQANMYN